MLVKVSVQNFKSFDQKVELSMIASGKTRVHKDHCVKFKQTQLLKNAVLFGANASGKSNFVKVIDFIKTVLLKGLPGSSVKDYCRNRESNESEESVFELIFTVNSRFYAYGFSAVLSRREIAEEWLFELLKEGGARQLFLREGRRPPVLGECVKLTAEEKIRFSVYAEDFAGQDTQLFLAEMNRGKRYSETSNLVFFPEAYRWIINSIIVINPASRISNTDAYYSDEPLGRISNLLQAFDTGISKVETRQISIEEMCKLISKERAAQILNHLMEQMQASGDSSIQSTWRKEDSFFTIRIQDNSEPLIQTLVLKHGMSESDFSYAEESAGTKQLLDLIDMLLTDRPDTVFVVDDLERSLHPKLTERFLKLLLEAHAGSRIQLICTTNEAAILDLSLFRRDEIWFMERTADSASRLYPLDRFTERLDRKLSKAYLEGRYGAIPVFRQFSFRGEN